MFLFWDWTFILVIIGAVVCGIAQWNVTSTFNAYSKIINSKNLTARQVAETILANAGINDVIVEHVNGMMTDHYSPNEKVLRLSDKVYNSSSVAAIGVAAHECGHAIQHKVDYKPLGLRSAAVPIANIGSFLAWPLLIFGLILGFAGLSQLGVFLFGFVVIFQVITLPVEFDASKRAIAILGDSGILAAEELDGAKKVLRAAALTYVAALFASIMQLVRMILLSQRRR